MCIRDSVKSVRLRLYAVVFTFDILSEIVAIADAFAVKPETPASIALFKDSICSDYYFIVLNHSAFHTISLYFDSVDFS